MWPYWTLYLLAALPALAEPPGRQAVGGSPFARTWTPGWVFMAALIALMVGGRFEVGGDWFAYFHYLDDVRGLSLWEVVAQSDPGYHLLNWLSDQMGWGIVGVNAIGGAIFALGISVFCRTLPRPWLALAVAIPYLVIVVGMGYTRQGIALALAMLGLISLQRQSTIGFLFWVVLGATFHRTAVLLLPIAGFMHTKRRLLRLALVALTAVGAYWVLLADSTETLYQNYVEAEYQSQGALIRVLMNAVPASLLLVMRKRFERAGTNTSLWRWFSWLSLGFLLALAVTSASTAVDRLALYMLPLQLIAFSAMPGALSPHGKRGRKWVAAVVLYYAAVLFVWLNFATHADAWLPYQLFVPDYL